MKKILLFALAVATLFVSCEKETPFTDEPNNAVSYVGRIENVEVDLTKTDYDIAGEEATTAVFHWTGTEKIGQLRWLSSKYFQQTVLTSLTSANSGETELVFSGTLSGGEIEYALYPIWNSTAQTGIGWSSSVSKFQLYLPPTLEYDSNNPRKNIIPMVGKLTDGEFTFAPVTAVIAVRVKNLPSDARKISLSSTGTALSGLYHLTSYPEKSYASNLNIVMTDGLTKAMASNASNTTGISTFKFSSGLDKEEHTFYFPVSVGTLSDLTITIKNSSDEAIQTVSYPKSLTTARGRIEKLPLMDLAKATTVSISGTATDPCISIGKFGPGAAMVRYAVDAVEATAKTNVATGTEISSVGETRLSDGLVSGKYYLAYQVLDSSNNVLREDCKAFYFLTSDHKTLIDAEYIQVSGSYVGGLSDATRSITVRESDDPTKGNVMITEFLGICYDVSESTAAHEGYTDGAPVYGQYPVDGFARFDNVDKQVFYKDNSGASHYLLGASWSGSSWSMRNYIRIAFNSDGYTTGTSHDLVIWEPYLVNSKGESFVVAYGGSFVCNKASYTYTVAGDRADVFTTAWDQNESANDLVYDPSTMLFTGDFTVPTTDPASGVAFKVVKNHTWGSGSEWPASNYQIESSAFNDGYSAATLTINYCPKDNSVSHSITYDSGYYLYVLPEIVPNLASTWGTSYSMWGAYNFQKLDDATFGSYTYACFSIPDALFDGASHDIYFKGKDNCEILLGNVTFDENVHEYYYRTDGFNAVVVTDKENPAALPTGNKLWMMIGNATKMAVHMYGENAPSNTWDTPFAMTKSSTAKLWGKYWYYLDLSSYSSNAAKLVIRYRIDESDDDYNIQTTDITNGGNDFSLNQSLYFYSLDTWTDGKLNWQRFNDPE